MQPIRILIADDHPLIRDGIRMRLDAEPSMKVVGEAATGEEAIALIPTLQPDVVLMDLKFSNGSSMNGIEATQHITQHYPNVNILVITMFEDDSVLAAIRAGAKGYVLKGADSVEVLRAIHAVNNKEGVFSPSILRRMQDFIKDPQRTASHKLFPELTNREHEILALIATGYTNDTIAEKLSLSRGTIRNQVSIIYSKIGVDGRLEAIELARQKGLGKSFIG